MKYLKVAVRVKPLNAVAQDLMQDQMGELGFESFVETDYGFDGYIQKDLFADGLLEGLDPMVKGVKVSCEVSDAPDEDWNAEWEKNYFSPITVDDRCVIRSTFHDPVPGAEYEILINPQMAFGTGHHETTRLMVQYVLDNLMDGKDIIDMGCGTGILGILALKRGAHHVIGVDIDEWSVSNAHDNLALNGTVGMDVRLGGAEQIADQKSTADIVLANINRNILMRDMAAYVGALKPGGQLILSGFYDIDCKNIAETATALGMHEVSRTELNKWMRMQFVKQA